MARHQSDLPGESRRHAVRIIGGAWRGRRLAVADSPGLRPTPDRVRETLFNWLQHSLGAARCLDLFAGTGVLGLEALSRGAKEAVFVELAAAPARNLLHQIKVLKTEAAAQVVQQDAAEYLRGPARAFDVVFLDPPFAFGAVSDYALLLDAGNWVAAGGLVYLETPRMTGRPRLPSHWEMLKSKSAGEVGYHLARVNGRKSQ